MFFVNNLCNMLFLTFCCFLLLEVSLCVKAHAHLHTVYKMHSLNIYFTAPDANSHTWLQISTDTDHVHFI